MLKGKKILLGISGSIAAYKANYLVRLLIKQGAQVKIILTTSAKDFVSSLTLGTLSKNPVLIDLFDEKSWANHVELGRWADVMIIAPLSCNTLAKMAHGLCDNLLLATYLSATCPIAVAPAMDEDMWQHPATRANISLLQSYGNIIIPVEKGELASGLFGEGRMAEPDTILAFINNLFFSPRILTAKKAIVTAGPTYEHLDPVRFIGNQSSGKMGLAIANELHSRGAEVTLILGPSKLSIPPNNGIATIHVTSAEEMYNHCEHNFGAADIVVMAAAVADYSPVKISKEKIKKKDDTITIELSKTKDILKMMGERKRENQVLIGFALETNNEQENAKIKLQSKNADLIVLNSMKDTGAGFAYDTNKITIYDKGGQEFSFEKKSKTDVAKDIIDTMIHLYYA